MLDNEDPFPLWLRRPADRVHKRVIAPGGMELFRRQVLKWAEERSRRLEKISKWEARRDAHAERIRRDPQLQDKSADPPKRGWEFDFHTKWTAYAKASRLSDRQGCEVAYPVDERVCGWTPPRLLRGNWPEYEPPLPLPERSLTTPERFVVLAVIHDACYKGVELINPWLAQSPPDDTVEAAHFHAIAQVYADLIEEARRMPEHEAMSTLALIDTLETPVTSAATGTPISGGQKPVDTLASKSVDATKRASAKVGQHAAEERTLVVEGEACFVARHFFVTTDTIANWARGKTPAPPGTVIERPRRGYYRVYKTTSPPPHG